MKCHSIVVALALGMLSVITQGNAATGGANVPAAPHLSFDRKIDLSAMGGGSWVQRLSFSPNSRYLAIADTPNPTSVTIIVWDLLRDREQTRIAGLPGVTIGPQVEILWSVDGRSITLGSGAPMTFWDPLTGRKLNELMVDPPVNWSRFNRNGTKLLVSRELIGRKGFRIYNTGSWAFRDYGDDGLIIETLSWTADDRVLVAGLWPKASVGQSLDGITPGQGDTLARLVDPSGREAPRSVVIAPRSFIHRDLTGAYSATPLMTFAADTAVFNYPTNKIALGLGKIIDGRTLDVFTYAAVGADIKFPISDLTFSPDGNYLYLLGLIGIHPEGSAKSLVLDAHSGARVATFPAGQDGLAVSPDGKRLAIGNGRSVELYDIQ